MNRIFVIAGVLVAGFSSNAAIFQATAVADELTITSWGGAYQTAEQKAYFEPYTQKTGTKVIQDEWNGEIAKIRAMVESKSVSWDVVDTDTLSVVQGCNDGILETLDWGKLGLDRSKFIGAGDTDCGLPHNLYSAVVAYDKDKLTNAPTTIADVFDLQKFPGKRGLQKDPSINLEWALVADGVPVKDVYKVLGTPEGVDRAFKKLDTIKKNIVWWDSSAQAVQMLASGQVAMASSWNGRIYDANKNSGRNFGVIWDAQVLEESWLVVPKGGPRTEKALDFVRYVGQPEVQATLTKYISYGPANKDATQHIDPAILPYLPTAPEHMTNALLIDAQFWSDHGDELRQRFTAWLAQ